MPNESGPLCSACCDTGVVVRELEFRRCMLCVLGQSPIADHWHGRRIHPLDLEVALKCAN